MGLVYALNQFHARDGIGAILFNETDTQLGKTAALWAENAGIPRFLVMHGANINRTYPISMRLHAEWVLTFGERGGEPFVDDGVDASKLIAIGNPAWDHLRDVPPPEGRVEYRGRLAREAGLRPELPTVVFATTWRSKLTAVADMRKVEEPLRCFFAACRTLESEGFDFNACVKARVSNDSEDYAALEACARDVDWRRYTILPLGIDMIATLMGSDVLVACDSNASIEATLLDVAVVNVWSFGSWFDGPSLREDDGIEQVRYDEPRALSAFLRRTLFDSEARFTAVARARDRVGIFTLGGERPASECVADFVSGALALQS